MPSNSSNVTMDPLSWAIAVEDPEIVEITDLISGEILDTRAFIRSHRYGELVNERVAMRTVLKRSEPRYACAICGVSVYLISSTRKWFFFRHSSEDGSCPAQTRSPLSEVEIRARKYHGLKESDAHKHIKNLIERSLRADKEFDQQKIHQEKRWRSDANPKVYRQPDVQACIANQRFAFEVQLSTTFLDVVVGRRIFYEEEGALLIWVLGTFSPSYRRLTVDDLLFSNNSNIFVVDEETTSLSEESSRFHLRCFFRRPFRDGKSASARWENKLVAFKDVVKNVELQQAYIFDYATEERLLLEEINDELREELIAFWDKTMPIFEGDPAQVAQWKNIQLALADRNITVPDTPRWSNFQTMVNTILSAKRGEPVGWKFNTLIQVAHHLTQGHTRHLLSFGYALEVYGHKETLEQQDISGKWKAKREEIRQKISRRDAEYMPEEKWLSALMFLFPPVGERIAKFLEK